MVRNIIFIFSFLGILLSQNISISVDKNTIDEGDVIQLSIEASGSSSFAKVDLSLLEQSFEILGGPYEKSSMQFINGRMNQTKTLTWTISPKKTGLIAIPGLKGIIDGKPFVGKTFNIMVNKTGESNSEQSVFILAELDKDSAYLGEQITLTYKLYKDINTNISGIEQFQMPDFNGFWVEEIFTPQRLQYQKQNVIFKGIEYQVANLGQRALFPISSEKHIIPSVKLKTQIEIKRKKNSRDPFFDPFFDSFFNKTQTKYLKSNEKFITIIPFPDPRPDNFFGAVGSFKIHSEIDQEEVVINEGFTFKISLKGTGNLGLFTLPEIKFPNGLDAFPPNDSFKKDAFRNEITGSQELEYVLVPRKEGNFKIPSVQISYFNLKTKTWSQIGTNQYTISVKGDINQVVELSGLSKKEIELIGKDIRFINTEKIISLNPGYNLSIYAYLIYLLSGILFIIPITLARFTNYRLFTADDRKMKNALKISLKILENNNRYPFENASKAIYTYMHNRFLLKNKNLDPVSVNEMLQNSIDKILLSELIDLLKICDAGKYGPNASVKEDIIISKAKNILISLNKSLK
ncbi:MAG: hypothetical protein CMG55_08470 [Candidatus Marinimicrobia bacterium]|nr:hypothetical protein [Candidatus Neomarinimicrobiota bacterium]